MVTFMIVWMRRHARGLEADLERAAGARAGRRLGPALVVMAFFAVLREGLETAVFLLAAFQSAAARRAPASAPLLGVVVAVVHRLRDLPRRRQASTSRASSASPAVVLVLVAAGLLVTAAPHRPRGRLAQRRPGAGARPAVAGRPGHPCSLAADRGARHAAAAHGRRGRRLARLRRPDAGLRAVAAPPVAQARPRGRRPHGRPPSRLHRMLRADTPPRRPTAAARARRPRSASAPPARRQCAASASPVALTACGGRHGSAARPPSPEPDHGRGQAHRRRLRARADARARPGRPRSTSRNAGAGAVTEVEVLRRRPHPRREGEPRRRACPARSTCKLGAGDYTMYCPGGRRPSRPTLTVTGATRRRATTADAALPGACAAYRSYVDRADELLAGHDDVRRRGARPATSRGEGALRAGPRTTTRRSSRSPRASATSTRRSTPASTTSRPRREWTGFHRIEKALWADGTLAGMAPLADKLLADVEDARGAGPDGSSSSRPSSPTARSSCSTRSPTVEDHRRGGPLLAHRPVRLRGQRRRRAGGVRRCCSRRCAETDPALADDDRPALRRRERRARRRTAAATASSPTRQLTAGRHGASSSQAVDALAEPLSQVAARSRRLGGDAVDHDDGDRDAADERRRARQPARLLLGAGAAARRSALGGSAAGARRDDGAGAPTGGTVPFHGAHQAGIATPGPGPAGVRRLRRRDADRGDLRRAAARLDGRGGADDRRPAGPARSTTTRRRRRSTPARRSGLRRPT